MYDGSDKELTVSFCLWKAGWNKWKKLLDEYDTFIWKGYISSDISGLFDSDT